MGRTEPVVVVGVDDQISPLAGPGDRVPTPTRSSRGRSAGMAAVAVAGPAVRGAVPRGLEGPVGRSTPGAGLSPAHGVNQPDFSSWTRDITKGSAWLPPARPPARL